MRISTKGKYSLEALLYLALVEDDNKTGVSAREIAEKTGYSEGYLEQLFILLRKEGILKGLRGPQGGYCLEKKAENIMVGDILRAAEGLLLPASCVAKACPEAASCCSHNTWEAIYEAISSSVDAMPLADLARSYKKSYALGII
jgi:Rrf2 family protein